MPGARMGGCLSVHALGMHFRCGSHARPSLDMGPQRIVIAAHPRSGSASSLSRSSPAVGPHTSCSAVYATLGLAARLYKYCPSLYLGCWRACWSAAAPLTHTSSLLDLAPPHGGLLCRWSLHCASTRSRKNYATTQTQREHVLFSMVSVVFAPASSQSMSSCSLLQGT